MKYISIGEALLGNDFFDNYTVSDFSSYPALHKELVENESVYKSLTGVAKISYLTSISRKVLGYSLLLAHAAEYRDRPAVGIEVFVSASVKGFTNMTSALKLIKSIYRNSNTFIWNDPVAIEAEINTRSGDSLVRQYALCFYYSIELVMKDLIDADDTDITAFSDIRDVYEGSAHPKEMVFSSLQRVSDYVLEHKLAVAGLVGALVIGGITIWKK